MDLARSRETPDDAGPRERELLEENARLRRIASALMERVESAGMAGGAPYAAFEHAVLLAEQVRERTETLQRTLAELHAAKAEAEAANLSKTRFLAAVSHDLLQPLNAARLFTSALEDHPLPEPSTRLVGHIGRSLKDVEALLGTLVDISRLDAGVLEPDIAPFPVARLLDVLAEEYCQMAAARGLELHYVGSGAVVASDLALLARVVRNFLTNAILYTGSGKILLGCRRRPEGVEILVGDSGPGIPEAQREAIFQEFQRLGGNRGAEDRGLGLGLAIVDRIAGMLGHPLRLASVPGRGSLFSVLVPQGRLPPVAHPPTVSPRLGQGPGQGSVLERARVWVIDNDPGICKGMAALLEGWGCRVLTATSLADLDIKAVGERADVLLVDFHLGEEDPDGLAVAARLRERQPGLPVIVITANHDATIKGLTRQLGYNCLLKPLKPLRLRMALVDLLGGESA
ncbi:hybrid sensor histidine kinase/response regulator [Halomonas sp. LR5S13]|uniref:hybrid sensor histidine kinase/response regulator n=1 Tax=Halomonas rhizosphaerae TaxID=3043296 RepID=UPI0024A85289|nr:hybrid sensor histidine kinase/response regulator [Halomonas rhizosphaerae]MDI5921384.1 hybrid sensor histidine kinase/response regulator [Halomonas rhizosphaerae]